MKKILFTVGLWCLALCMQAAGHISRLRAELQDSRSDYVFVVAHRGDWRHAPENSVAAIKGAADMGVDMVEIDIQRTKDGGFVLMHDGSIDRTTEGKGNVADYTVEELKRFRLRRADGSLSDETIPTLEEALTACKGAVLVNIDKGGDYLSEIAPIIRKTGTEDHVVLKGRGPATRTFFICPWWISMARERYPTSLRSFPHSARRPWRLFSRQTVLPSCPTCR